MAVEPRLINFLHIGKTAGLQITHIAQHINATTDGIKISCHTHNRLFRDISHKHGFFFSIRHPVGRFQSGFYSRKRKGQPRHYQEWSKSEDEAFGYFEHANHLAEALFTSDEAGEKAYAAMISISHLRVNQVDYFAGRREFLKNHPPIWIIRQEHFSDDIKIFAKKIKYDAPLPISNDPVIAHKNDYSDVPSLSAKARKNILRWYSQDLEFYRRCHQWLEREKARSTF